MILCGGMGSRLREETEVRPKPMIEIGGRPILWHIMKGYAVHGFTDFVICLGYKGDRIKEYFLNYEAMNNDFTVELGRRESIAFHHGPGSSEEHGWRVTLADTGYTTIDTNADSTGANGAGLLLHATASESIIYSGTSPDLPAECV